MNNNDLMIYFKIQMFEGVWLKQVLGRFSRIKPLWGPTLVISDGGALAEINKLERVS